MKLLAPWMLLALATACDSGADKDTEVTDDTEESQPTDDTDESGPTDDTEESGPTDDTEESQPTDDTEESEPTDTEDTEDPGDGVSPEVISGSWSVAASTSDCSIVATADVEDPQGDSTLEALGGYLKVMEGSTEVADENIVICNTLGACSGSLAESRYDIECDDADSYTVLINVFDEDGNSTGYTELTYSTK